MSFVQFPLGPDDLDLKKSVGPHQQPGYRPQATPANPSAAQPQAAPQSPIRNANIHPDGMSAEGRAWQRSRAGAAPQAAATPQTAPAPVTSPIREAGRMAGRATAGAKDWAFGKMAPVAEGEKILGKVARGIRNYGGGAVQGAARIGAMGDFAGSYVDNVNALADVNRKHGVISPEFAVGAAELLGNTVGNGVLNMSSRFPVVGPAISYAVGNNIASRGMRALAGSSALIDEGGLTSRTGFMPDKVPETPIPGLSNFAPSPTGAAPQTQTPTAQPTQPALDMSPEAQVARAEQARVARVAREGAAQPQAPATPRQVGEQIFRVGNSFGDSPEAAAWGARTAPISTQNMAAADNLAARQPPRGLRAIGDEAIRQQRFFPSAPQATHSGNDFTARQNLRSLKMAAESAFESAPRRRYAAQHPAVQAYIEALKNDTVARYGQAGLDLETNKSNNGLRGEFDRADAQRYATDMNYAGDVVKAEAATNAARSSAIRNALNDERDYTDKRRDKSRSFLADRATIAATGRDGEVDHGLLNQINSNVKGKSSQEEKAKLYLEPGHGLRLPGACG